MGSGPVNILGSSLFRIFIRNCTKQSKHKEKQVLFLFSDVKQAEYLSSTWWVGCKLEISILVAG